MKTLKAKNLKNKPRNYWKKYGWLVYHLHNGYWLTGLHYSKNFNSIKDVKAEIIKLTT